ncbi:MAG: HAMP domain-containing histidine kinase [Tepidibacter sp.]|jgi:signal transduction histidine kinase|uniref:HAMP domain-containing sensor histidine kinase n=1 Tax=Tepidibacter sp. TaxID=2529387 RepID=UPI0025DE2B25|nr:HAMP domain-containing sensor histidine kinase [Tepidibacter sp.]MCT4509454.1 HAMP domain-containing histidine kinase [Tepidibacter sp.]
MKKSIRTKLFIGIVSIVVIFVVLLWGLNSTLLEKYYINQKKNILIEASKKIDHIYTGNIEDIYINLEIIRNTIGANIRIVGPNRHIKYISAGRYEKRAFNPIIQKRRISTNKKYVFELQSDKKLNIDFLALRTILRNKDILILKIPMPAISESASIANKFMVFTGLLAIIIGIIWAFVFSKKFTEPVLYINNITKNIANLNFSQKCILDTDDEFGELGKNINYLSSELDKAISSLHQENQKLEEDIERKRKIDNMRKEFISSVSHELKTPISLIQGYSEGLKENVIESEEDKEFYCDIIIDEAKKMDFLVKDLLNLSQIESGYFKLEKTKFNICDLIDQTINKYKNIFYKKNIDLKLDKGYLGNVFADNMRIEQILVNFINNAIDHVGENNIIKIIVNENNEKIRVGVFNSGKHISKPDIDKIWTSFYKVDKARTREYGGYGLGLSIVRAIQELHKNEYGTLNVENGVMFWFNVDKTL